MGKIVPLTNDERFLIYRLWCHDHNLDDIARKVGRDRSTVIATIRKTELSSDWRDWPDTLSRTRIPDEKREEVLAYRDKGMTCVKIAEITGVSKSSVHRILSGKPTTT